MSVSQEPATVDPRVEIINEAPMPRTVGGVFEMIESWVGGLLGVLLVVEVIVLAVLIAIDLPTANFHWPRWISVPLLVGVATFDLWFVGQVWSCLRLREYRLGPALAERQRKWLPGWLRFFAAAWWLAHCVLFVIFAVAMHRTIDATGKYQPDAETIMFVILYLFVAGITFTANVYAILALAALTQSREFLETVWRWRFVMDVAIVVAVAMLGSGV